LTLFDNWVKGFFIKGIEKKERFKKIKKKKKIKE
jgi:hypothetical protein